MKIAPELYHYFREAGICRTYQPEEIIYLQEETTQTLYLVIQGRVRIFCILEEGTEITLDVLDAGNIFGDSSFFGASPRPTTVQAVNTVKLISCTMQSLYPALKESYELTISLLTMMSQMCEHMIQLLRKTYQYDRFEKVAFFLLELTQEENPQKGIVNQTLPYTHEEVAESVGLTRSTVSRVLREFAKKGFIENRYKKIRILDRAGIEQILSDRHASVSFPSAGRRQRTLPKP